MKTGMHAILQYLLCIILWSSFIGDGSMHEIHNSGALVDGDIMLSDKENLWNRNTAIDLKNKRWPGGIIPYDFNLTEYNLVDLHIIREGMKEIEKNTCIRFIARNDHKDYIFVTPHEGCWSYLGRIGSGQTLSLVVPQCIDKGTVIHELMHAIGFWHEHSRPDRDEHIEVLWDNIINTESQANFAKHMSSWNSWTDYPYDYKSVMHYSAYAFSKRPNLPTLLPKKPQTRLKDLGRAKAIGTLTEIDKMKINAYYECSNDT